MLASVAASATAARALNYPGFAEEVLALVMKLPAAGEDLLGAPHHLAVHT